jgi:hypothetical protein
MSSQFGTPFVETEALLAVANEDTGAAEDILRDMLPGELARLRRDARELAEMCASMERIKAREESNK